MPDSRARESEMTRTLIALALIAASAAAYAGTAFLVREYETGDVRHCVYDYFGSEYVRTISAFKFCPYSIEVE